jgi:hypothetical protein
MSDIVGKPLNPSDSSSLQDMLDLGLGKFIDKYVHLFCLLLIPV